MTPWPNATPVLPKGGASEPGSAACVAAEVTQFINGPDGKPDTDDDIQDLVLITHSGGSNVVRYILQQHSARPEFARMHSVSRGFIGIAAPSEGTYLADRVFAFGVLSIGNALFKAGYDDDGVDFIQTAKMAAWNKDPAKLVNLDKDVAGVPSYMASGSFPDADGDAEKVACGGESETKGLNKLHALYLGATDPATFRDGCSDGFITCQSAMALTNNDESRVVFGMLGKKEIGKTHFRAHNQSRRSCDGLDVDIRGRVNAILENMPPKGLVASARPQIATDKPYVALPAARTSTLDERIVLENTSLVATRTARVRVRVVAAPSSAQAFLVDPTRERMIPATFERAFDGSTYAVAELPNNNPNTGVWMMHVGEAADIERHTEARLPIQVSNARGRIARTKTTIDREAAIVRLDIVATEASAGARLGAHATLTFDDPSTGKSVVMSEAQTSIDAKADTNTLSITFALPFLTTDFNHLVARDIALVSHDDASTLDRIERVDAN